MLVRRALVSIMFEMAAYVLVIWAYGYIFSNAANGVYDKDPFETAFPHCSNPCIVRDSPGGRQVIFERAAEAVLRGERDLVIIDGRCASACVLFADIAREKVCVTEEGWFALHKGYGPGWRIDRNGLRFFIERFDPPQSKDILEWVDARGGFPTKGLVSMDDTKDIAKIWKLCQIENVPLPRPRPQTQKR